MQLYAAWMTIETLKTKEIYVCHGSCEILKRNEFESDMYKL